MTRSSSPIPAHETSSQAGRATRPDGLHHLPVRAPFIIVSMAGLTGRVEHGDSYVSTRPLRQAAPQKDKNPRGASRARSVGNRASGVRSGLRVAPGNEQAAPLNLFGAFTAPRNRLSDIARVQPRKHSRRCNADLLHVRIPPVARNSCGQDRTTGVRACGAEKPSPRCVK